MRRRVGLLAALLMAMALGCSDGGGSQGNGRSLAPDFRLSTLDGRDVQLSDYRGKVVLIHFWATWCEPCLAAIPFEMELQEKFGRDSFVVLGLNMDRKPEDAREYLEKHPVNYPVLQLDPDTRRAFGGISTIPYTILVDQAGYIRKKKLGYQQDDRSAIERKIVFLLQQNRKGTHAT